MNQYRKAWGDLRRPLRRLIKAAPSSTLILHMPKTGGSSLQRFVRESPSFQYLVLPMSNLPRDVCECGATSPCADQERREAIRSSATREVSNQQMLLQLTHENYGAVDWVRSATRMTSESLPVLVLVRPRRVRLRSMFTDYWTQVATAMGELDDDHKSPKSHRKRQLKKYVEDAVHYRKVDGSIDGVAWFTSFARYGPGVVFSLDEVFGGDATRLQRELESGALIALPTSKIDEFIEGISGLPAPPRIRISRTGHDPAVEAALDDAADLIEELARRDARFDQVIADHLGDPDFYVE